MLGQTDATPKLRKNSLVAVLAKFRKQAGIYCLVFAASLLQAKVAFSDSLSVSDPAGGAAHPIEANADFVVGNMAGVKISIPKNYLIRGPNPHYKGEDVWSPSKVPSPTRNFESEILDFGLLLRDTDLQPILTKNDLDEYQTQYKPSSSKRDHQWITIEFQSSFYVLGHGNMQAAYENWMKNEANWGPWIPQETDVSGLKHFVSKKQNINVMNYSSPDEFFYDPSTRNTFISCTNRRRAVPPFDALRGCEHKFDLPELRAQVRVNYSKNDLPRWREIESLIKAMAYTLVVP